MIVGLDSTMAQPDLSPAWCGFPAPDKRLLTLPTSSNTSKDIA